MIPGELTAALDKTVIHRDIEYRLKAIVKSIKDNSYYYQCVLQDKCNRSITIANCKDVVLKI